MRKTTIINRHLLGTALALALVPGMASAEPFSGPYAGVEAGLGKLKTEGSTLIGPFKRTDETAVVSAVAGYRMPLGEELPVVLGVEGNAGIHTNGGDARYGIAGTAGVKIGDAALLYGKVGYAWLDGVQTGAGEGIDGLLLGGGAELALTDSISARAEYRYIDYGGVNFPDNTLDFKGHEVMAGVLFNF